MVWALEENPRLLTGEGSLAPHRAILKFIDLLHEAGIAGIVRPACPRCRRVVRIDKPLDGQRVCRNCIAKSRVAECVRCGARREPATRDDPRATAVSELSDHRPREYRGLHQLRRTTPGTEPHRRRSPLPQLLPPARRGLRDLRPHRTRHALEAHRSAPLPRLFRLATELPAAVLARTLGIDITVAVKWRRAAAGDWVAYAAEVSRRNST
ncbi:hypothetical protein [Streptomyces sp. YS-3]|uniref:hypothetical protein n=1 Tax=Streptomyces sp. YS-3 TaxID=3381352 RepID=UPI0038622642